MHFVLSYIGSVVIIRNRAICRRKQEKTLVPVLYHAFSILLFRLQEIDLHQ